MQTKTNERSLPKGWQWVKLGDICEINPRRPMLDRTDSALTTFIQMSAVDDLLGVIARPEQRPFSEIKKGYTYFAENDVFFAKITPCMENGKHAIARKLIDGIGFGSTEFHVIRPNENILAEWIWHFVRQPYVRQNATSYFTGAVGQQRVPDSFLKSLEIPLPPLDEQRRIASRLSEQLAAVESARKAAEEQLHAAYQLSSGYLREVFEGLFTKSTQKRKLGDFVISYRNGFGRRPTGNEDSGVIVLRLADVTGGKINLETPRRGAMTDDELETYSVKNGDLLFVRVNGSKDLVGRCAIVQGLPEVVSYNDHLIRVRLNGEVLPEYIKLVTDTNEVRNFIVAKASTSAGQLTINQEMISSLEIPNFSLSEQRDLIQTHKEKITESDSLIKILESQLAEIESLPASLLREAFAGGI